ncbi:MAG: tetratricopeptide repeat protein [Elusimicrobia bacterium]|nr:tetratricopeptide repeat protein [Elusimicrobiota bacterium]
MKKIFLTIIFLFLTCPVFSKNIAVIPFQNISGDKEKNWIGAGFSETLTTKLVKVKEITVLEREQLSKILEEIKFQYSGAVDEKTAVKMGKMYGADVLVFGSFQVMGEKLRITARFVDVQTRKVIDTAEANGNISDIFKLQDEIAFSLMDSLKIVLGEKEKEEVKVNPTDNLTAYQWLNKGNEVLLDSDLDIAIEEYDKAIELDPKYIEAYIMRGFAYFEKDLYDKAIENYTKVIEINPKNAESYRMRGLVYERKKLYVDAIKDFSKLIKLNPKFAIAYSIRGDAYSEQSLYEEAIEDYTRAIELNSPSSGSNYFFRGVAYYKKGDKEKAIKDFKKASDFLGEENVRQDLKSFNINY